MPEPGFYGALYDYWYSTGRLNDRNGNGVRSVTVGPGPGVTLDVDVHVNLYAVSPMFLWVSDWKIAGAQYAAYIAPSFANSSIEAALTTVTGRGINADTSSFGVGDLFVQPRPGVLSRLPGNPATPFREQEAAPAEPQGSAHSGFRSCERARNPRHNRLQSSQS